MALVERDGSPAKAGANTASLSFNITLAGVDGFVALFLKWYGSDDILTVTCGGVPMPLVATGTALGEGTHQKAYGLMTGAMAGVQPIVITRTGANFIIAAAQAYKNVSQVGQPVASTIGYDHSGIPQQSVAPVVTVGFVGSWVVGGVIAPYTGAGYNDWPTGEFLIDSDTVVPGILGLYDSGIPLSAGSQAPVTMGISVSSTIFDGIAYAIALASAAPPAAIETVQTFVVTPAS